MTHDDGWVDDEFEPEWEDTPSGLRAAQDHLLWLDLHHDPEALKRAREVMDWFTYDPRRG